MERVIFKNSRGLNLVGDFYPADSGTVIIMAHGFTGDRHEWDKFDRVAEMLNKKKYNVLTFDFSGSGESDDDSLTIEKEVDDLKAATRFVLDRNIRKIGLIGLSLGGLISLKVCDEKISTMALWAPVTASQPNPSKRYTPEHLVELKETGFITYTRDKGFRKKIIIDKQMLEDRKSVNQKELLSKIHCPVLIVHGTDDKSVPVQDSQNVMQYLGPKSELVIVEGGHHFRENDFDDFVKPTIEWFKKQLPV